MKLLENFQHFRMTVYYDSLATFPNRSHWQNILETANGDILKCKWYHTQMSCNIIYTNVFQRWGALFEVLVKQRGMQATGEAVTDLIEA
jgi:hypothetical protein